MRVIFLFCNIFLVTAACTKTPKAPLGTGNRVEIITDQVTSITSQSANAGGTVIDDGGSQITMRGVCWSVNANPSLNNSFTSNGEGIGTFLSPLTLLSPNRTYFVRAYATNSFGTVYGDEVTFLTSTEIPSISTTLINTITQTTASSGGNVTSTGGATVTQRGVCWNTTGNPTIANSRTNNGAGIGSFTSILTPLTPNTNYYVRAYATNIAGTAYGANLNFTTLNLGIPTLQLPTNNSVLRCCNINFLWTTVAGATGYVIQVSKSSSFTGTLNTVFVCGGTSNPIGTRLNTATTNTNSFCMNTGTAVNNGVWYWRVRAVNGTIQGAWSGVLMYNFLY